MLMALRFYHVTFFFLFLVLFTGCAEERLDDYSDSRFELVDQNGETVIFPDDFEGSPLVMGFIYTHCPDICSFITANIKNTHGEMENPADTQFVLVTFDPERDTPGVLKSYAGSFEMDREPFRFLTGQPDVIEAFMERVGVRAQESYTRELENGDRMYFLNHSDKILLIDRDSRLVFDYGGSMTPANIIIEDLEKL